MLFEIWIVDASILQPRRPVAGWCGCLFVVACPCGDCGGGVLVLLWRVVCIACLFRRLWSGVRLLAGSGLWWWWGLVVCVTSCEGHMVDALASRADEGRRSLR